jgi:hypothetical protein
VIDCPIHAYRLEGGEQKGVPLLCFAAASSLSALPYAVNSLATSAAQ